MTKNFTVEELLQFNEMMLGRGMPVEEDGIGYNKADFGACATYFYGCSNAQLADLAKRLVKYCDTQLHVDKQMMKDTAEALKNLADPSERSNGVSIQVKEDGVLISFRYNEQFIEIIKKSPKRQYDAETKNWIVPLSEAVPTLNALWTVGADVENALQYIMNNDIYLDFLDQQYNEKVEVLTKEDGDYTLLKFKYNEEIVKEIKQIDRTQREWNSQYKFWAIHKEAFVKLAERLADFVSFKAI